MRFLVVALCLLGACRPTPEPPAPSLEGMEPQVAATIRSARAGVEAEPRSGPAWGRLGRVFEAHGMPEEAKACYSHAAELSPDETDWRYHLAALEQYADPSKALALIGNGSGSVPALVLKATLEEQLGRADDARATYVRILDVDPRAAIAEFGLGRLALAERDLDSAETHLLRSAELQPRAGAVYGALARVHRLRGDEAAARETATRAGELHPDVTFENPLAEAISNQAVSTRALQTRARSSESRGDVAAAEQLHRKLVELHPDDAEIQYNFANFLNRRGRAEEAEGRYRRALDIDGEYPEALVNLANLVVDRGELNEGERLLRRAVALEPDGAAGLVGLSNALAQRGELGEAASLLERVREREPTNLGALHGLAQIRAAEGRFGESTRLLERALSAHPDDGRTHFFMALSLARSGDVARAWPHVRDAERLGFPVPEDFIAALRESTP